MLPNTSEKDALREPLLDTEEGELWTEDTRGKLCQTYRRRTILPVAIHLSIAMTYFIIITAVVLFWRRDISYPKTSMYLPAQEALHYEFRTPDVIDTNNPYIGDPRPEHDQAWSDLTQNSIIRLSEEEMIKMNKTSLALKDGSGYIVELAAYHELHCVKWIRKWINRDYYWPALEGAMLEERKVHIDHCLELMRFNAMCRGAREVKTFGWYGSQPTFMPVGPSQCVNWGKFDSWSAERRVDLDDLDTLQDRPEPEPWELLEYDVRLGVTKGKPEQDGGL